MGNLVYPEKTYFLNYSNKKKVINYSSMTQIFGKYQKDNVITFHSFNECIKNLFSDENFPLLPYTYLSEKLFRLIDQNKKGAITYEQFTKAICMALSSQEKRMEILFEAMKSDLNKNYLTFEDVYKFFLKSWISGFNYIYGFINFYLRKEFIEKNIPVASNREEILNIPSRHKEDLYNYLLKNFHDSGINIGAPITYEIFKKWIIKDNTLEIIYANKIFKFATSILYFENIALNIQG